jgi:endonuclease/exonuclease/phosphatase (EEP) superfamily protein YafD
MDYIDLKVQGSPVPQRIVIDVEGQPVAIYNAHMAWPVSRPHIPLPRFMNNFYITTATGFDDRVRNTQIRRLLERLQTEEIPFIVGGDFNTSDYSLMHAEMSRTMTDSFIEAGYGLGGSWPNSAARGLPSFLPPLIRIDYIWHSDEFQAVRAVQGPRLGSDHIPLVADLVLTQ